MLAKISQIKSWLKIGLLGVLVWSASLQSAQAGINQQNPQKMIEAISNEVTIQLNKQRTELEGNPEKINQFANTYVMPYLDSAKMARYVMGRFWRAATPIQQSSFVDQFSQTLLRSYSVSLLKLKITKIIVKSPVIEHPGRVLVSSSVTQADGNISNVSYRLYFSKQKQKWFVYDVVIEGISMLLNYRKSYASEFSSKGISKVIADMKAKNKSFLPANS